MYGEKAINRDDGLRLSHKYLNLTFIDKKITIEFTYALVYNCVLFNILFFSPEEG